MDIKKQIKDFTYTSSIIGTENIIFQNQSGTTGRTHINNLPFLNSTSPLNWDNVINTPTTLEGYGITNGGSGSGTNSYISITHSSLLNLKNTNTLSKGSHYIITNFKTCYDQPDYDANGDASSTGNYKQASIQPIVVFANSTNSLDENVFQPLYPNDKIKYDLTFIQTEKSGGIAYGRITERIDEFNNRTDYDHRNILFKRYRSYFYDLDDPNSGRITVSGNDVVGINTNFADVLSAGTNGTILYIMGNLFRVSHITDNSTMGIVGINLINGSDLTYTTASTNSDDNGDLCYEWKKNNLIGDEYFREFKTFQYEEEIINDDYATSINNNIGNHSNLFGTPLNTSVFLLANNVFGKYSYSNIIGNNSCNNTSAANFYSNTIVSNFQYNTIKNNFYGNKINQNLFANTINQNFYNNTFNNNCENNEFGQTTYNNIINNGFTNNYICNNFHDNIIENEFHDNIINKQFYDNLITNNFNTNKIYNDFYKNTIDNDCNNNNIHGSFYSNKIKEQFESNTLGDFDNSADFNDNFISNRFKGNQILGQCTSNIIGVDFYSNNIIELYSNNIGNFFAFHNIGSNFEYNNIIGGCIGNTMGDNFQFNNIQYPLSNIDFSDATFVYGSYNCTILRDINSDLFLNYFDGTINQYVAPTA